MKRGKFSNSEDAYIREHIYDKTPEEIAQVLDREPKTIERYMKKHDLVPLTRAENHKVIEGLKYKLYSRPYWRELKQQLTEDELVYFQEVWIELMRQFNEDVLASEEFDLREWVILDILKNRSMKDRLRHIEEAEKLEAYRDKLIEKDKNEPSEERGFVIQQLTEQVMSIRGSVTSYTAEHAKFLEKAANIAKGLKAVRSERIQRVEDGKTTFAGHLRLLNDEKLRRGIGGEIEIMRHAKEVAKQKLSEYHTYVDDQIDRPLLTPEIVLEKGD